MADDSVEALQDAVGKDQAVDPVQQSQQDLSNDEVQPIDFYISYRELDSTGYTDKDIASRLAGALQKEKRADGTPVSVFAPDGEAWEVRLKYGLEPANNVLLLVSEDGLRAVRDADRCEDVTLLEYEYSLAQKLKGKKRVMLLLVKDKTGANFSSFSTDIFPDGEVSKIAMPPCHKSKKSAPLWDSGAKKDLLIPDNKPGEHSIRMTMDELFRLTGTNVSMKSVDIKAVVPTIVAMLKLRLPAIPTEKQELHQTDKVLQDTSRLTALLIELGPELLESEPILKSKFGVGSVEDLAGLQAMSLAEPMLVDKGKIVLCDHKTMVSVLIDNEEPYIPPEVERWVVRALKVMGMEKHIPEAHETFQIKLPCTGMKTVSTVGALGKRIKIGDEERIVSAVSQAIIVISENDEGKTIFTELTEELLAKTKLLRDKGGVVEPLDGRVCIIGRYFLNEPLTVENSACVKEKIRDRSNSKEPAEYTVEGQLSSENIAKLQKATQTALGVSPGGVSLAQTYGHLFKHRIKSATDVGEMNHSLMDAIKAQDAKVVGELLRNKASANFKDDSGWSPLHRACSARMDSGDLGMNYIGCNQIIEILVKAGADVMQTNGYGRTPLHYAAMEGNFYAASVLVHSGADVDCKDNVTVPDLINGGVVKGASPSFHAKLHKKNDWEKVVQLLDLYTNELPPPKPEKAAKKGKGKKKR
mmetsp:Transcript_62703/g.150761  ORF Transcript_62703/g.150761 Transcript_62703/m.150761 type:complete len:698 (-) Transcript_62703:133-2226(-)